MQEVYLKKFDLKGNQLNLLKLDNNELTSELKDISFSFDENGKNLILSLVNLKFSYRSENKKCTFIIFGCRGPAMVPPKYSNPIVNIFKFDDNLNYCLTKVGFNEEFQGNYGVSSPYITQKRDRVIFPLSYEKVAEITIKDNTLKNVYLGSNIMDRDLGFSHSTPIKIIEDDNHDFYFASDSIIYKTNKTLNVIKSKNTSTDIQEVDPNTSIDKVENISLPYFFNKNLDLFRYKTDNSIRISGLSLTMKLGDKFLILDNNNFKIVDSL